MKWEVAHLHFKTHIMVTGKRAGMHSCAQHNLDDRFAARMASWLHADVFLLGCLHALRLPLDQEFDALKGINHQLFLGGGA